MSAKGTSPKKTAKAPGAKPAGSRKPTRASSPKGKKAGKARKGKNTHWRFTSISPAITAFLAGSLLTLVVVVFLSQEFFAKRMQRGAPAVQTAQVAQAVKAQQKNKKTPRQGNASAVEKAPVLQTVADKKRGEADKNATLAASSDKAAVVTAPFPSFRLPRIDPQPSSGAATSGSSSVVPTTVNTSLPVATTTNSTASLAVPAASVPEGIVSGTQGEGPLAGAEQTEAPKALSFKTQSEVQAALQELQALPYEEDLTPEVGRQPVREGKDCVVPRRQSGQVPMMVVVMDDLGMGITPVKRLIALNVPVTFAFWPHGSHTQEGANMAHRAGEEVLVHFPMEPVNYPKVKPGPNALLRTMTAQDVATAVQEGLAKVPHAVGLNNHMGSRFTQNRPGVQAVLDVLQRNGLFMLDSLTHPRSVFYAEAVRRGMQAYCRNVFLDVRHDKKSILARLRQTEAEAKRYGVAIAIGHPLPETLAALEEWQHNRDMGVKVVRLQELP